MPVTGARDKNGWVLRLVLSRVLMFEFPRVYDLALHHAAWCFVTL